MKNILKYLKNLFSPVVVKRAVLKTKTNVLINTTSIVSMSFDDFNSPMEITETKIFGLIIYRKRVFKTETNSNLIFPIDI